MTSTEHPAIHVTTAKAISAPASVGSWTTTVRSSSGRPAAWKTLTARHILVLEVPKFTSQKTDVNEIFLMICNLKKDVSYFRNKEIQWIK
jgi:hypothetical protein